MFCQKISLHEKENRLFSFLKFRTIRDIFLARLRCIVVLSETFWGRYLRIENILLGEGDRRQNSRAQVAQSFPWSVSTLPPSPESEIRIKWETVLRAMRHKRLCPGFHLTSKLSEIKMFASRTLQVSGEPSVLCLLQPPLPPSRGESCQLVLWVKN